VLTRVLAIGGGAQSDIWVDLVATLLNLPVDLPENGEFGAALGAARLAICGVTQADPHAVMTPPRIRKTIQLRRDLVAAYDAAYQQYRASYAAQKTIK